MNIDNLGTPEKEMRCLSRRSLWKSMKQRFYKVKVNSRDLRGLAQA